MNYEEEFLFHLPACLSLLVACGKQDTASMPSEPEQFEDPSLPHEEQKVKETFKYVAPLTGLGTNEELP